MALCRYPLLLSLLEHGVCILALHRFRDGQLSMEGLVQRTIHLRRSICLDTLRKRTFRTKSRLQLLCPVRSLRLMTPLYSPVHPESLRRSQRLTRLSNRQRPSHLCGVGVYEKSSPAASGWGRESIGGAIYSLGAPLEAGLSQPGDPREPPSAHGRMLSWTLGLPRRLRRLRCNFGSFVRSLTSSKEKDLKVRLF